MITPKEYLVLSQLVYVTDCTKIDDFSKNLAELDLAEHCWNNILPGGLPGNWKTLVGEMTDWKMVGFEDDNKNSGFRSVAYEKSTVVNGVETTEIAFSFAGTEPLNLQSKAFLPEDILDDVSIMSGRNVADYLSPVGTLKFGMDLGRVLTNYIADAVVSLIPNTKLIDDYNTLYNKANNTLFGQQQYPDQFGKAKDFVYNTLLNRSKVNGDNIPTSSSDGVPSLNDLVKFYNVSFGGHSLGGGIAQYMAYETASVNAAAVTFDAVGIYHLLQNPKPVSQYNVVDYVDTLDIVGNATYGLGKTVRIKTTVGQYSGNDGNIYKTNPIIAAGQFAILETHMLQKFIDNLDDKGNMVYQPDVSAYIYDKNHVIIKNPELTKYAGSDTLKGTSNSDVLRGYEGDDKLYGLAGKDIIDGGSGNDYMEGGAGSDTYTFGRRYGNDVVYDYDKASDSQDVVKVSDEVKARDLMFNRVGDDLIISINGATDTMTVKDQFKETTSTTSFLFRKKTIINGYSKIEKIQLGNGNVILDNQIQQLIQGMSAFSKQTGLTWSQAIEQKPQDVDLIITKYWSKADVN